MPSFLSDRRTLSDADLEALGEHIAAIVTENLKSVHERLDALVSTPKSDVSKPSDFGTSK